MLRRIKLNDKDQGEILLAILVSKGSDEGWGEAIGLRGTEWERAIRPVSGEDLSHALHGWATPLARTLGERPSAVAKRLRQPCARVAVGDCPIAGPKCVTGPATPECFEPPTKLPKEAMPAAYEIAMALRDGYHVVRVLGSEFVIP